jgi:methionyl-tRNA formyltransferase
VTPARTIFLGTGEFAVPIGDALARNRGIALVGVVTAPPRRGSRGQVTDPPVATWASERDLPLLRPERLRAPESVAELAVIQPDLLVLADYGQIVPQSILDLPGRGALNVHPSLLPRHRGATPVPATILAGDSETGVTAMLMDAGLDTGPIVGQSSVSLDGGETAPDLEAMLAREGALLLDGLLPGWLAGDIEVRPQPAEGATLTRPLRREDGRLDATRDAPAIERQVRAYQPWPGTFFETTEGRVIIWRARAASGTGPIGTLVSTADDRPAIVTADGALELVEVQPAGGRRMSGVELVRGRPALIGQSVA